MASTAARLLLLAAAAEGLTMSALPPQQQLARTAFTPGGAFTPLMQAATHDIDLATHEALKGAVHEATAAGDAHAVSLLLGVGLPCESTNAKGSTPLHIAAVKGHEHIATALLDAGASANAPNDDGLTPLHAAVSARQLPLAQLLLSRGASTEATSTAGMSPLRIAAQKGDAAMIGALQDAGAQMDQETTQVAFWAAVNAVEACDHEAEALSADVPRLMRQVYDADLQLLLQRGKVTNNVTCMQPEFNGGVEGVAAGLTSVFDSESHADLPLEPGRRCEGGDCCDACSRVTFPRFSLDCETDFDVFPELEEFCLNDSGSRSPRTVLIFLRLIERVRRVIAHEYNLELATLLPLQCYSRVQVAGAKAAGGGSGQGGDGLPLHTDEGTHASYHYSSVLYLGTQGEDFEGGSFVWNDPPDPESEQPLERVLTPYSPTKGAANIFSSGWENMHQVTPQTSGNRRCVPAFFTTCPVPEGSAVMPENDEEIADELQRLLFDPQTRSPFARAEEVKEFMMKWSGLLAPEWAGHALR